MNRFTSWENNYKTDLLVMWSIFCDKLKLYCIENKIEYKDFVVFIYQTTKTYEDPTTKIKCRILT